MALPVWTRLTGPEARAAWEVLSGWLHEVVFTRYDSLAEAIQPCWYRHPEVVEQLSWLCAAWQQIYCSDESTVSLAAEWHLRWAPYVQARVGHLLESCFRGHNPDPLRYKTDQQPDDGGLAAFIDQDVATREATSPAAAGPRPRGL